MSDESLAAEANIPVDILRAIRQVESGGNPASIRFEPHVFLRETSPLRTGTSDARRRASPYFDRIPFTRDPERGISLVGSETNRAALERARGFDEDKAIKSTSWGTYQVLGRHLISLYPTNPVDAFYADPVNVSDRLLISWFRSRPAAATAARTYNIMELARLYNGSQRWGNAVAAALRNPRDTTPTSPAHALEVHPVVRSSLPVPTNDIIERISAVTADRTDAPTVEYGYFTVAGAATDVQANQTLSDTDERSLILSRYDRFYDQVVAMKTVPNIKMTEVMPVIEVTMYDEGRDVHLNELIFGTSTFENYFNGEDEGTNPERPIASLDRFQINIEPTSVGATSLSRAELSLKIHNPELVNRDHPRGKYISYMLALGYNMRIKYGVNGSYDMSELDRQALQWKEEDFMVTHYRLSVRADKTADLIVHLQTNTRKLLNQIFIGESIPAGNISDLSTSDINDVVSSVVSSDRDATTAQTEEIRRRVGILRAQLNSERESIGLRTVSYGSGTFGSTLHGAISNAHLLENPEGVVAIPIENMVEALQTIQAVLLTRRYNEILADDCYRYTRAGTSINAVNLGPLFWQLAKPELDLVLGYAAQNGLRVGETYSFDDESATVSSPTDSSERRTGVKMIFGNFNSSAGQWANKPISMFPINMDDVFALLRERRSVGEFSCKFTMFCDRVFGQCRELESFSIERSGEGSTSENRVELPEVRYEVYKDPTDPNFWVFYVYDNKAPLVRFRNAREAVNSGGEAITKQQVIDILNEQKVAYFEMGENGAFLREFGAETISDDTIASNAMILANRTGAGIRDLDASPEVPAGISRDFMAGNQIGSNTTVATRTNFLPVQISMDAYAMVTAPPFINVFVFFPMRGFTNMYIAQNVTHQITKNRVMTQMNLLPESSIHGAALPF